MLTDFYRDWMIEITNTSNGFLSVCYASNGERFSDRTAYTHQLYAWRAACRLVDQSLACVALKQVVRDAYEAEQLTFEDWQRLRQSLDLPLDHQRLTTESSG